MIRHLFAFGALFVATSGLGLAGASPLEALAVEIVQRERGAPANTRHDTYLRLRSPTDFAAEAVWRVGAVRLSPVGEDPWPGHAARERYRVHGCEALRVAQARPAQGGGWALPRVAARRAAAPARAGTRSLTLVFGPGSLLAVAATPTAGGGLGFAASFVIDAELWSEVVRLGPHGPQTLPGREPEGTLGRLVPQAAPRTVEISGRILGLDGMNHGHACPRLRLITTTPGGRWVTVQQCGVEDLRGVC